MTSQVASEQDTLDTVMKLKVGLGIELVTGGGALEGLTSSECVILSQPMIILLLIINYY